MWKRLIMLGLTVFIFQASVLAQFNIVKLRDVKSIYVDEKSFNFKSSSCLKIVGNQKIVCSKHLNNRNEFLAALKSWIEKYKFTLVSDKDDADAILQGDLSIDDEFGTREHNERTKIREKDKKAGKDVSPSIFGKYLPGEPLWEVNSWLINQNGNKLWTKGGWFPEPSFGWSSTAKIQAKKLAREIQYDFEKSK